jgi:hypothetical protein
MSTLKRVLGYGSIGLGAVSMLIFMSPIFPAFGEAFLFGGIFFGLGAWVLAGPEIRALIRRALKTRASMPIMRKHLPHKPAAAIDPLLPVRVLKLAKERQGSLSISDVAIALSVPLAQAELALKACQDTGYATEDYDMARGYTLYRFPEFLSPEEQKKLN